MSTRDLKHGHKVQSNANVIVKIFNNDCHNIAFSVKVVENGLLEKNQFDLSSGRAVLKTWVKKDRRFSR